MRISGTARHVISGKTPLNSLQIRVYQSLEQLETLRPAWAELLAEFPSATTFSSWEWLAPWWRAFGESRELLALAFLDDSGKLVGLAPLQISRRHVPLFFPLRVLGLWGDDSSDSDNLDIPVLPGYEALVVAALVEFLQREAARWDVCEFNTMPAESPVAAELVARLGERGWTSYRSQRVALAISLPETWEMYLRRLSSKERGKIAYYRNRLQKKYRTRFYRCQSGEEVFARLESLFALHRKRWQIQGQMGSFASTTRCRFYQEMAGLLAGHDELEFWLLDLDGKPAAAQFGFRHRDTVFQLQEGFDPAYFSDSVGYVLRAHVLEQLIARGVRRYDFLAGEAESKARWATEASYYLNQHFARPFSAGAAWLRAIHAKTESKEWLREHLPSDAWQVLHALNQKFQGNGRASNLKTISVDAPRMGIFRDREIVARSDPAAEAK